MTATHTTNSTVSNAPVLYLALDLRACGVGLRGQTDLEFTSLPARSGLAVRARGEIKGDGNQFPVIWTEIKGRLRRVRAGKRFLR